MERNRPPGFRYTKYRDPGDQPKLHLFGQLKRITKQWLDTCLVCKGKTFPAQLMYQLLADIACSRIADGRLLLFRNFDEHGNPIPRPRTLLIDSEQLESGEVLDENFRKMAVDEIDRFRREIIERVQILHYLDAVPRMR